MVQTFSGGIHGRLWVVRCVCVCCFAAERTRIYYAGYEVRATSTGSDVSDKCAYVQSVLYCTCVRACVRAVSTSTYTVDSRRRRPTKINTDCTPAAARHSTRSWSTVRQTSRRSDGCTVDAAGPAGDPLAGFPVRPPHHLLTCARLAGRGGCMQTPGRKRISLSGVQPPHPRRGQPADAVGSSNRWFDRPLELAGTAAGALDCC